jgi:predicted ABC-type ATPase
LGVGGAPHILVLAGPNGAGKSTAAPALIDETLGIAEFVNADVIATGLSAFDPERVALEAGRLMLIRLRELAKQRVSFAFETTLASRSFAPWIAELVTSGYSFHLCFLWLSTPEQAVLRVDSRVRSGGHHVPEETIRRRYNRGLRNFFMLYQPLATTWRVFDSSQPLKPQIIARGVGKVVHSIARPAQWDIIVRYAQ